MMVDWANGFTLGYNSYIYTDAFNDEEGWWVLITLLELAIFSLIFMFFALAPITFPITIWSIIYAAFEDMMGWTHDYNYRENYDHFQ